MPDDIHQILLTALGTLLAAFVIIVGALAAALAKRIGLWGNKGQPRLPAVVRRKKPVPPKS